jgi:hypothetical protein
VSRSFRGMETSGRNNLKIAFEKENACPRVDVGIDLLRSYKYCVILPPFINIRYFRFVKQMYLDKF